MALTLTPSGGENGLVNVSFSGAPAASANQIVAAPGTGKSIRVYGFTIYGSAGDNVVYWTTGSTGQVGGSSGAVTVNKAGPLAQSSVVFPGGVFTGAANEALSLVASTTEAICGVVQYKVLGG